MIPPPRGCSWELRAGGYWAAPLDDPGAFRIRYVERLRPLTHPLALAAALFPRRDPFTLSPLVTVEGEYGALVAGRGCALGIVIGDDFQSVTAGESEHTEQEGRLARLVEELTVHDTLLLGHRRRRYRYQPPAEWQGLLVNGFDACFYASDHPNRIGCLMAHAALPQLAGHDPTAERAATQLHSVGQLTITATGAPLTFVAATGLSGCWLTVQAESFGAPLVCESVCLADRAYLYGVCLYSAPESVDDHRAILRALVDSVEPLSGSVRRGAGGLGHWMR